MRRVIKALFGLKGLSIFFLSMERGESLEMFKRSYSLVDYTLEQHLPKCIEKITFMGC